MVITREPGTSRTTPKPPGRVRVTCASTTTKPRPFAREQGFRVETVEEAATGAPCANGDRYSATISHSVVVPSPDTPTSLQRATIRSQTAPA